MSEVVSMGRPWERLRTEEPGVRARDCHPEVLLREQGGALGECPRPEGWVASVTANALDVRRSVAETLRLVQGLPGERAHRLRMAAGRWLAGTGLKRGGPP